MSDSYVIPWSERQVMTLNDIDRIEFGSMSKDQIDDMNRKCSDVIKTMAFSNIENKILAEKLFKMGYISQFAKYEQYDIIFER